MHPARLVIVLLLTAALAPVAGPSYADGQGPTQGPTQAHRAAQRGVKHVHVPAAGRAVPVGHPAHTIGNGTPASCTSAKVVRAVARGGVITFDCGPAPVTIAMTHTAKVHNAHGPQLEPTHRVVLDGRGLVTLSGMGKRRILYQNTCDQSLHWTTNHCDDQAFPKLVVQNLTFVDGRATGHDIDGGSGGAVYAQGGQLKIVNSTFLHNRCFRVGPDLGGAAVRALEQFRGRPVYVVHSTFRGGRCSNGSALSSIGVSWTVLNSVFLWNKAIGHGANPPHRPNQPGGGSGGAIYTDGNTYTLRVAGTLMRHNHANEGGGAIFYVSNDLSGRLHLRWSTLERNVSAGFETRPGIFYEGRGPITVQHTILR